MPTKPATKKALAVENDENAATTRVTRAKAAALGTSDLDAVKTNISRSKSTTTASSNQIRKRAALGDVSNVAKENAAATGKKGLGSKGGAVAKAAQPTRVQKISRSQSTRTAFAPKDRNAGASDLKRPASGSGSGHVAKRRITTSTSSKVTVDADLADEENIEPAEERVKVTVEVKSEATEEVVQEPIYVPRPRPTDVEDLDEEDRDDPLMVSEYVGEIFEYLLDLEQRTLANGSYMENQPELEWSMRGILVDWLLEVHTRFRLLPETLFLAVNIIDRFLSAKVVQLDRLQLVGVTAMFIASKYEEVLSPHVSNFRHVADDGFTEDEILSAERFVLAALNYNLSYPNPMNFLRRISKADNYDVETRTVGKYLLEISCLDHKFIEHAPSQIAAAAMYVARKVLDRGDWDSTLAHYSGYTYEEMEPCVLLMLEYVTGPVKHDAFFKKYAHKKFLKASMLVRTWAKQEASKYLDGSR